MTNLARCGGFSHSWEVQRPQEASLVLNLGCSRVLRRIDSLCVQRVLFASCCVHLYVFRAFKSIAPTSDQSRSSWLHLL